MQAFWTQKVKKQERQIKELHNRKQWKVEGVGCPCKLWKHFDLVIEIEEGRTEPEGDYMKNIPWLLRSKAGIAMQLDFTLHSVILSLDYALLDIILISLVTNLEKILPMKDWCYDHIATLHISYAIQ